MHDDTRQNPSSLPALVSTSDDHSNMEDEVADTVIDIQELLGVRNTLENYREQIVAAGKDGLDDVAKQIMQVNLKQLKLGRSNLGLESFKAGTELSLEDFSELLKDVGARIKALIDKLIAVAKQLADRIMSGVDKVKGQSEELLKRIKDKANSYRTSTEFHEGPKEITIDNPGMLFADGEFCIDDSKAEQDVIRFLIRDWPRYAIEQVNRAKKMIGEYDVDNGTSENFNANAGFIGNHESLVLQIKKVVMPGNKSLGFKFVALGPELVDAEGAKPAPNSYTYTARTDAEIQNSLRKNVALMNALGQMFAEEANVLQSMATLSQAVMDLENKRPGVLWKSAKQDLDVITNSMMELVTKLKPNYEPIANHIAKVGAARNAAARRELDAVA